MNKTIIIGALALCGATAFGASSQTATAIPGTDNISFGYGAGYASSGENQNVVAIGTDAGKDITGCNGCVYIGNEAGLGDSAKTGSVDINGKFVYDATDGYSFLTNATLTAGKIYAWDRFHGWSGADFYGDFNFYRAYSPLGPSSTAMRFCEASQNIWFGEYTQFSKSCYFRQGQSVYFGWDDEVNGWLEVQTATGTTKTNFYSPTKDIGFTTDAGKIVIYTAGGFDIHAGSGSNEKDVAYLQYTSGSSTLDVMVNGSKVGTIAFTPVQ